MLAVRPQRADARANTGISAGHGIPDASRKRNTRDFLSTGTGLSNGTEPNKRRRLSMDARDPSPSDSRNSRAAATSSPLTNDMRSQAEYSTVKSSRVNDETAQVPVKDENPESVSGSVSAAFGIQSPSTKALSHGNNDRAISLSSDSGSGPSDEDDASDLHAKRRTHKNNSDEIPPVPPGIIIDPRKLIESRSKVLWARFHDLRQKIDRKRAAKAREEAINLISDDDDDEDNREALSHLTKSDIDDASDVDILPNLSLNGPASLNSKDGIVRERGDGDRTPIYTKRESIPLEVQSSPEDATLSDFTAENNNSLMIEDAQVENLGATDSTQQIMCIDPSLEHEGQASSTEDVTITEGSENDTSLVYCPPFLATSFEKALKEKRRLQDDDECKTRVDKLRRFSDVLSDLIADANKGLTSTLLTKRRIYALRSNQPQKLTYSFQECAHIPIRKDWRQSGESGWACYWCLDFRYSRLGDLLGHLCGCHSEFRFSWRSSFGDFVINCTHINCSILPRRALRGKQKKVQMLLPSDLPTTMSAMGHHLASSIVEEASGKLPPAFTQVGRRYKMSSAQRRSKKKFRVPGNRLYLATLDLLPLNEGENIGDSEDDDGDYYQWDARAQQARLTDRAEYSEDANWLQHMWHLACRAYGPSYRTEIYNVTQLFLATYGSEIHDRGARSTLTGHLVSLSRYRVLSPEEITRLLKQYDELVQRIT